MIINTASISLGKSDQLGTESTGTLRVSFPGNTRHQSGSCLKEKHLSNISIVSIKNNNFKGLNIFQNYSPNLFSAKNYLFSAKNHLFSAKNHLFSAKNHLFSA